MTTDVYTDNVMPKGLFRNVVNSIYQPSEDSYILIDAVKKDLDFIKTKLKPKVCLEIGCGSGIVITTVAQMLGGDFCTYVATDINPKAIETTKTLSTKCGLNEKIEIVLSHFTFALNNNFDEGVDILLFNPPFMPSFENEVGKMPICSWAAGPRGRNVIDSFIKNKIPNILSKNGVFYMCCIERNNVPEIVELMKGLGFNTTVFMDQTHGTERLFVLKFTRIPTLE